MNKHITDEKTGISYTLQGDYYLPDLALPPEEEQPIGVCGQRYLRYLRQHKSLLYSNLLTSGKLNSHLADVDRQAEELFSRLVKQMAERESVTEALKATNQMEWVGRMNNIRNRAMEIVNNELIYGIKTEREATKMIGRQTVTDDIPKIFWKYYDLFRRKKITLSQYSEETELSVPDIKCFFCESSRKKCEIY